MQKLVEYLASNRLTIALLLVVAFAAFLGTVIPQNAPDVTYEAEYGVHISRLFEVLGITDVYGSWWFVGLLGMLGVNLICCLGSRWSRWIEHPESLIRHIGFIIILIGGAATGFIAERGTMKLEVGKPLSTVYVDGEMRPLGSSLRLIDFTLKRHDSKAERLLVRVPGDQKVLSYPVSPGRRFQIQGTSYSLNIERYVPDFAMAYGTREIVSRSPYPNNPAVQVVVSGPEGSYEQWVFAEPAGIHSPDSPLEISYEWNPSSPVEFMSRIEVSEDERVVDEWNLEVNHPKRYKGRTFYQYSYDPERWQWSGILVIKDPGVWIVYAGFGVVVLGLVYGAVVGRNSSDKKYSSMVTSTKHDNPEI